MADTQEDEETLLDIVKHDLKHMGQAKTLAELHEVLQYLASKEFIPACTPAPSQTTILKCLDMSNLAQNLASKLLGLNAVRFTGWTPAFAGEWHRTFDSKGTKRKASPTAKTPAKPVKPKARPAPVSDSGELQKLEADLRRATVAHNLAVKKVEDCRERVASAQNVVKTMKSGKDRAFQAWQTIDGADPELGEEKHRLLIEYKSAKNALEAKEKQLCEYEAEYDAVVDSASSALEAKKDAGKQVADFKTPRKLFNPRAMLEDAQGSGDELEDTQLDGTELADDDQPAQKKPRSKK